MELQAVQVLEVTPTKLVIVTTRQQLLPKTGVTTIVTVIEETRSTLAPPMELVAVAPKVQTHDQRMPTTESLRIQHQRRQSPWLNVIQRSAADFKTQARQILVLETSVTMSSVSSTSPVCFFANINLTVTDKTIGKGTFGKVKLGIHELTNERVAVKILEKDKIQDVNDVERVAREIHILKLIRHPNIIQLYEIIETPKQLYLIMEYANGGELFDYIVKNQRVKEPQAL